MKIKVQYYVAILFLLVPMITIQIGCKKDESPSNPLVFVTPDELHIYVDVGDVIAFNITATSESGLASFKIESKIDNGVSFTQIELDETLSSVGKYNKLFEMIAPQDASGSSLVMTFTTTDVNGQQTISLRRVWVLAPSTLLSETAGHVMYNHNSPNADAYNLELGLPIVSKWSTDSAELDIMDFPMDTITKVLSRSWISPSGGTFVKFNGFDYANATDSSLSQAFSTGVALPQIANLTELDIILYKFVDSSSFTYAVIQITDINSVDTTTITDSYVFNLKK